MSKQKTLTSKELESKNVDYSEYASKSDNYMSELFSKLSDAKTQEDIEKVIGHKLYDKWYDENFGSDMLLGIFNGSYLVFYYLGREPNIDEFAVYASNSAKTSIVNDLGESIKSNPNPDVVMKCIDKLTQIKSEGAVGLRKFITDMREKYGLASSADYNGDKFFIPIMQVGIGNPNAKCDCKK